MSQREFERAALLRKVHERRLTQAKAAELLGLSLRQVERLYRRYRCGGPSRRRERAQQPRRRRECFGELIQIDGCDHEWFEERAPRCTLLVYVDDATSRILQLHFCSGEATFEYFEATRGYLQELGKPVAFYSDKAGVFRVNAPEPRGGDGVTQFGRALSELNIDIICANSPAAKGRVERAHLTLQDRLVKELRLRGISTIEAANAFAPDFRADFNGRFARPPRSTFDAHRPLLESERLDEILTWREVRKVSGSLTVNYQRRLYLLEDSRKTRPLAGKCVTVVERKDGSIELRHGSEMLPFREFEKDEARVSQGAIVSNKLLAGALQHIKQQQAVRDADQLRRLRTHRQRQLLLKRVRETG